MAAHYCKVSESTAHSSMHNLGSFQALAPLVSKSTCLIVGVASEIRSRGLTSCPDGWRGALVMRAFVVAAAMLARVCCLTRFWFRLARDATHVLLEGGTGRRRSSGPFLHLYHLLMNSAVSPVYKHCKCVLYNVTVRQQRKKQH